MRLKKTGWIAVGLAGVLALVATVAILVKRTPQQESVPKEIAIDKQRKLQDSLRDASLLDLIRNARVASRKGDRVTHDAMLTGLKREPQRSRSLITSEIAKSNDSADKAILNRMMEELP